MCFSVKLAEQGGFGKTFSVKEGFAAVVKHANTAKHIKHFRGGEENNNDGAGFEQIDTGTALRNQTRKNTENRQIMEGQILVSNLPSPQPQKVR